MLISLRWLQEFVELPTDDPGEIADVLAAIGHEVEGYQTLTPDWKDVNVGEVIGVEEHPDADRIRVCQVDAGSGIEQIICGAWNFEQGAKVAVALPGAILAGGLEIGRRNIRGVDSNGMICSERELGLGADHEGILVLDGDPEIGTPLTDLIELPDVIFDLSITPNRPDAMSLVGIARDLAAHYGSGHRVPDRPLDPVPGSTSIGIEIADPTGCRRFVASEITGVTVGPSPMWVRYRLAKSGIRPISNVVDVTNYVMLELGQPLHVFDADSISGSKLIVHRAAAGQRLVTLDDEDRSLSPDDLVISDDEGPTSMAGTMGGARSEVSSSTTRVLMEAASWDPPTIMYMSRRHALRSEASTRFERGVDPNIAPVANRRAAAMVADLSGGGVLEGYVDDVAVPVEPLEIDLYRADVTRLLGEALTSPAMSDILERLGMGVTGSDPLRVVVPTYRPDVTRPVDLVEEIARIHGYDRFGSTIPTGPAGGLTSDQRREREVYRALAGLGLHQTVNLPFVAEADIDALGRHDLVPRLVAVRNPLRDEERRLRPTLLANLLRTVRYNLSHGNDSVAVFESGLVFLDEPATIDSRLPEQIPKLAWAVVGTFGPKRLGEASLEADADVSLALMRSLGAAMGIGDLELVSSEVPGFHPGRSAVVVIGDRTIGYVGELHPSTARHFEISGRAAIAEIDLEAMTAQPGLRESVSPSMFPFVDFDLSFVVDDALSVRQMIEATQAVAGDLLERAEVFDEYRGPDLDVGTRAVGIRYRLRASDRTLTNPEVGPVRDAMISAAEALGATLRGAK